jgi:hypothetical protein
MITSVVVRLSSLVPVTISCDQPGVGLAWRRAGYLKGLSSASSRPVRYRARTGYRAVACRDQSTVTHGRPPKSLLVGDEPEELNRSAVTLVFGHSLGELYLKPCPLRRLDRRVLTDAAEEHRHS